MNIKLVILSAAVSLLVVVAEGRSHNDCFRAWEKVGCYKDKKGTNNRLRALLDILITDRDPTMKSYSGQQIDWQNWGPYLHNLACRCAAKARAKGYTMFGLQFYGECWSGKHAEERYNMYGESDKCFMELSNPIKTGCDISNENECMGQQNEIYVYRLKEDPFAS